MREDRSGPDVLRGAVWKGLLALAVVILMLVLAVTAVASFLPKLAPGL
jgi:uncharacterized membrane-anchored protein